MTTWKNKFSACVWFQNDILFKTNVQTEARRQPESLAVCQMTPPVDPTGPTLRRFGSKAWGARETSKAGVSNCSSATAVRLLRESQQGRVATVARVSLRDLHGISRRSAILHRAVSGSCGLCPFVGPAGESWNFGRYFKADLHLVWKFLPAKSAQRRSDTLSQWLLLGT